MITLGNVELNMGLFRNGIKAAIRQKKRFIVFGILFIVLSGAMIVQGLQLDSYNTDNLLMARGVVVTEPSDPESFTTIRGMSRGIYPIKYSKVKGTENLGVITIDTTLKNNKGELPWLINEMKPTRLIKGSFPSQEGEILINREYTISGGGDVQFSVAAIGAHLSINNVELEVSGVYPDQGVRELGVDVDNLIFVQWDSFKDLEQVGSLQSSTTQRVIITAEGNYLTGSAMEHRNDVIDVLKEQGANLEGSKKLGVSTYRREVLQTLFTFGSSLFLVALYSFLMVKFRKNEIATLRAIGWAGNEIKTYVLAELFTIIMLSYIFSLIFSLFTARFYLRVPITSVIVFVGSLGVILLTLGFGWLIISKGVLGVSPMEAFRRR